ncbi:MAG: Hsp20/alpha crystallin family protein [Deltaproteobacteria bacterium]
MAEKAKEKETKAVAPWRPFMDLSRWERDMDRMMDDFFTRRMRPWWPERWLISPDSEVVAPNVDVYEEKDDIVVKAELPGMEKNDIEVNIQDSQLTLKGEKKKEEKIEQKDYYRCERSYGAFFRSVELPQDVQADKVKASFKNGILEVRLPKSEEAKAKEIKIKVE